MAHDHTSFSFVLTNNTIESSGYAKHKLPPILSSRRYLAKRRLSKINFPIFCSIFLDLHPLRHSITQFLYFIIEKNRHSQCGSDDFSRLPSALECAGDKHICNNFTRRRQSVAQAFSLENT